MNNPEYMKMIYKSAIQIIKILLLTFFILMETGCSSMCAKTTQNRTVVSNVPVKIERNLQTDNKNILL